MNNKRTNFIPLEGGARTLGVSKKSLEKKPLVTIITSVLNGVLTIDDTIQSVLNQTYSNIEYIIIDGGSNDGTIEKLISYTEKIDYWISEPDTGIYNAWNKAIQIARGEWVLFLGSDDFLKNDAITELIKVSLNTPQKLEYISGKGELIINNKVARITGEAWIWKKFKWYVCTAQAGAIHNIALYKELGGYDESYKIAGDYEFLLRKGKYLKAGYTDHVTISFRMGGVSNRNDKVIKESFKAISKHSGSNKWTVHLNFVKSLLSWHVKNILKIV